LCRKPGPCPGGWRTMHFRELTDRYSLDKILRSTRTGSVLRATDSRSGQTVAVKLINVPSPADLVQRAPQYEKLATALEALHHANLPQLIDSGFSTEGSAFLVMELLDGRTLDLASGPPAGAALPGDQRPGGPGPPRHRASQPVAGQSAAGDRIATGEGQDPRPRHLPLPRRHRGLARDRPLRRSRARRAGARGLARDGGGLAGRHLLVRLHRLPGAGSRDRPRRIAGGAAPLRPEPRAGQLGGVAPDPGAGPAAQPGGAPVASGDPRRLP